MSRQNFLLLLFFLTSFQASAQQARKIFREADGYFLSQYYVLALPLYEEGLKLEPDFAFANLRAGICYLETVHKEKALPYLERAYRINPAVSGEIQWLLGQAYQYNNRIDEAVTCYKTYRNTPAVSNTPDRANLVDRKLYECENARTYLARPVAVQIQNVGTPLNSRFPDYAPAISADERVLVFTSRREGSTGGLRTVDEGEFYEDIYISAQENGTWTTPRNIAEINTDKHEACVALSGDGRTMLIYRDTKGGDLYLSRLDSGKNLWSKPVSLGENVNTKSQEPSACLSTDGNTLWFSSNRPGGLGGLDIYTSRRDAKGNWGVAQNAGPILNTPYDDDAPFLLPGDATLYFSSRGHAGMGGFDIFVSTQGSDGSWQTPQNLGYPINTTDDDLYLTLTADGKHGYYASGKEGGQGEKDIYRMQMPERKKP